MPSKIEDMQTHWSSSSILRFYMKEIIALVHQNALKTHSLYHLEK